jgi:C1A family cysteine protease
MKEGEMANDIREHGSGWIPELPDARDYRVSAFPHLLGLAAAPDRFSLRQYAPPIQDQGRTQSCVGWAVVRAFRTVLSIAGMADFDGSELFTYYNARVYRGWQNRDEGSTIRDGIKALVDHGNAPENTWPWDPARINAPPEQPAYDGATKRQILRYVSVPIDVQSIKQVIANGHPIVFGMTLYTNRGEADATGDWPMPGGAEDGGHALVGDGYDPTFLECPNSWGTGVGRNGFYRVPWEYIRQNARDAWVIEAVEGDAVPVPQPPPATRQPYVAGLNVRFSDGQQWNLEVVPPPWAR